MSYSQRAQQPTTARRLAVFMSCLLCAAALLHSVTAYTQPQQRGTERRVALVIGNAKYAGIPLDNPQRDARLIADTLRKLGFEGDRAPGPERARLPPRAARLRTPRAGTSRARRCSITPATACRSTARNYLLPVDINLRDEEEVKDESVDVDELFMSRIDKARGGARIAILDACRENPFAAKTRNVKSSGGLAEMGGARRADRVRVGARRCGGGRAARRQLGLHQASRRRDDGEGGVEVEQMFKNVRVKVLRDTHEQQIPRVKA